MATLPTKDCVLISFNSLLPELGQKIVEYIREELHLESCYCTQVMDLPLDSDDETPAQTELRESHIQDWVDDLVVRRGWNFQGYDPHTVLDKFLDLVFHAEFSGKARLVNKLRTQIEAGERGNSANADKTAEMKAKRPASSPLPQEMKRQKTVVTTLRDPALILDNMLKIVKESYTEKYGALMAAGTEIVKSKIMENLSPAIISLFEQNKSLNVDK